MFKMIKICFEIDEIGLKLMKICLSDVDGK